MGLWLFSGRLLSGPLDVFTNNTLLSSKVRSSRMTQYLFSISEGMSSAFCKNWAISSGCKFLNGVSKRVVQGGREGDFMGPPPRGMATCLCFRASSGLS